MELLSYLPKNDYHEKFVQTITDAYQDQVGSSVDERKVYLKQIQDLNKKLERARDLLLDDEIEPTDFRAIKMDCNEKIAILESKLSETNNKNKVVLNIKPIAEKALADLMNLDIYYENSSVEGKRYLISALFPEKMECNGDRFRTPWVNEIDEHIYMKNKDFIQKKQFFSELLLKLGVAPLASVDGFYVRFNASGEPKGENDGDRSATYQREIGWLTRFFRMRIISIKFIPSRQL